MTGSATTIRPGSAAYIDEVVSEPLANLELSTGEIEHSTSGSSVEEEAESDNESLVPQQAGSSGPELPVQRLEDFAYLDQRRHASDSDELSDESDWDVDDEDWELANGGMLR